MLGLAVIYKCGPFLHQIRITCFSACVDKTEKSHFDCFFPPPVLKTIRSLICQAWENLMTVLCIKSAVFFWILVAKCWRVGNLPSWPFWSLNLIISKTEIVIAFSRQGPPVRTTLRKAILLRASSSHGFITLCAHLLQFFPWGKKQD